MLHSRRNLLVATAAVVGGGGVLVGTGAFDTVEADRGVEVSAAGDDAALLAIIPDEESPYVEQPDGSTTSFELIIGEGEEGIVLGASTTLRELFEVTNNGGRDVGFYIGYDTDTGDGDGVPANPPPADDDHQGDPPPADDNGPGNAQAFQDGDGDLILDFILEEEDESIVGEDNAYTLEPGDPTPITLDINLSGIEDVETAGERIPESVLFVADSDLAT